MRKKKDRINDFKLESRQENAQTCINYVFDYYFKYLEKNKKEAPTNKHKKDLEKVIQILQNKFDDPEILNWLIEMYDNHNKRLDIQVRHFIEKIDGFALCYLENDFLILAQRFINDNKFKMPFLKEQDYFISKLIKLIHTENINECDNEFKEYLENSDIRQWLIDTLNNFSVNLGWFVSDYILKIDYDLRKIYESKFNKGDPFPFGTEQIYEKYKDKPFISDRKAELEKLFSISWEHHVNFARNFDINDYIKEPKEESQPSYSRPNNFKRRRF